MKFKMAEAKLLLPSANYTDYQVSSQQLRAIQKRIYVQKGASYMERGGLGLDDLDILDMLISEVIREFPKVENNERN